MERFIEFGEGKAQMVNNADWLLNLNYIELHPRRRRVLLGQQHAPRRVLSSSAWRRA